MNRHFKTVKRGVDSSGQNGREGNKVAEVKSGSVTLSIFQSRNSRKVAKEPAAGTGPGASPEFEIKYYDSFIIPYYEGSIRKTPRRSTIEKATKFAEETAKRLSLDGAKAQFLSERDRRIYILAKASAQQLGMDVDTACRKLVELQQRLKTGTLEQSVDCELVVPRLGKGLPVSRGALPAQRISEQLFHVQARPIVPLPDHRT